MDVQPDLFGQWCLMREWGRIGSTGRRASSTRQAAPRQGTAGILQSSSHLIRVHDCDLRTRFQVAETFKTEVCNVRGPMFNRPSAHVAKSYPILKFRSCTFPEADLWFVHRRVARNQRLTILPDM